MAHVSQLMLDARTAVQPLLYCFNANDRHYCYEEELDMWHDESVGLIFLKYWNHKMVKGGIEASLADCVVPWITLGEFKDGSWEQKAIGRRDELIRRCRRIVAQALLQSPTHDSDLPDSTGMDGEKAPRPSG